MKRQKYNFFFFVKSEFDVAIVPMENVYFKQLSCRCVAASEENSIENQVDEYACFMNIPKAHIGQIRHDRNHGILAFLVDQVQQRCCAQFDAAFEKRRRNKRSLWEEMRNLFHAFSFDSMAAVFEAVIVGFVRQKPMLHARTTNFTVRLIFAIFGTANRLNFPAETNLILNPFPTFVYLR